MNGNYLAIVDALLCTKVIAIIAIALAILFFMRGRRRLGVTSTVVSVLLILLVAKLWHYKVMDGNELERDKLGRYRFSPEESNVDSTTKTKLRSSVVTLTLDNRFVIVGDEGVLTEREGDWQIFDSSDFVLLGTRFDGEFPFDYPSGDWYRTMQFRLRGRGTITFVK